MSNKSKKKFFLRAEHNKRVCEYLQEKEPDYSDWVVTTAFYSALQLVKAFLFPIQIIERGKSFDYRSFDEMISKRPRNISKHQYLVDIVHEELPKAGADYEMLRDLSFTARYSNYQIDQAFANKAVECLENIEETCIG